MSVKQDVVNLVITVNGNDAKKKFYELQAKAADLRSEMNGLKKGTDEWIKKSKELKEVEAEIANVRKQVSLTDLSIKDLRKEIQRLKQVRDAIDPTTEAFKQMDAQVKAAEKRMKELQEGTGFLTKSFNFLKKEVQAAGLIFVAALGFDYVLGKIGNLIQRNAELSDSFADIRKTTGMSQEQVEKLNKELSKIDTRTAKKDLLDIAYGLGQIGQPATVEAIQNIDQIVVALGDEFGKSANEITSDLSILRNNFDEFKGGQYGEDILGIGNALNVLGQEGLATAPVVTDFSTRMSGVLNQFGVGAGKTLGLSAAMQELGINVERGSTAVTKLVQKMAQNPEVFAKVAGAKTKQEIKDFVELLNNDALAALLKVAKGAKEAGQSNTEFAAILKELESTGAGAGEVLSKFAANADMVTEKMNTGAEAIQKNDSITNEFALKNENLAGKLAKLQKQFQSLFVSEGFNNFLTKAVNAAISFIKWLKDLGTWIDKNIYFIKALGAAYIAYIVTSRIQVAIDTIKLALTKANTAATAQQTIATTAYNLVAGLLTLNLGRMVSAFRLLTTTMSTNPIIAITTAIVGLTTAISNYIIKIDEAKVDAKMKLNTDKLEANLKYRNEAYQRDLKQIQTDIREGNKTMLELDAVAIDEASKLRDKDIELLKKDIAKKEEIANSSKKFVKAVGLRGFVEKTEKERVMDKQVVDEAKRDLNDLIQKQNDYADMKEMVVNKLSGLDNQQAQSAKELTDKEKAELEKRKKAQEEFLKHTQAYLKELQDARDKVEQAKIDVIEEEKAREIANLQFKQDIELRKLDEERDRLLAEAKELKRSEAEKKEIIQGAEWQKLAVKEKFLKDLHALEKKYQKEAKQTAYNKDLQMLNDDIAAQKLLYSQLYAEGKISKQDYEKAIQDIDLTSKSLLVEIAKRYGIDVVKAEQDLANDRIKIMENEIERKKRLMLQEAQAKLLRAQLDQQEAVNNGRKIKDANKNLYNAMINDLVIKLATELGLTELNEQQILEIKQKYREQFDQLDQQYAMAERERRKGIANEAFGFMSQAFSDIFSFRSEKINQELAAMQASFEKQTAALDQEYKNRLVSDVEYERKKKANKDKFDKAEREQKRKAAVNEKVGKIFNIGIQTAQNIVTSFPNPFLMAAAAALGALEIGFVAATPVPQYYEGGFTKKKKVVGAQDGKTYDAKLLPEFENGFLDSPSLVLAGEKGTEYFVNSTMLKKPAVAHVVAGIESMSKGKMTYPDFLSFLSYPQLNQKFAGGYTDTTTKTEIPTYTKESSVDTGSVMAQMLAVLNKVSKQLDSPIEARAYIPDKTITDFNERNDYLKKIEQYAN